MEKKNHIEDSSKDLIIKFLRGETNLVEESELKKWLHESEENFKIFEYYRLVWFNSPAKTSKELINEEFAWNKLSHLIDVTGEKDTVKQKNIGKEYSWKNLLKVAAILIFIFLLGFFSSQFINKQKDDFADCEIITPLGSKTFLNLPDGSQVWLNAGSRLKYSKSFNQKVRRVYLQGEAFFKVKTNKKRPFIVSTDKVNVQALGTIFNVKAYPDEKYISATLVEGIIKVDGLGENKFTYTLKPKQNITVLKKDNSASIASYDSVGKNYDKIQNKIPIKQNVVLYNKVNTEIYTSWKDSLWTLKGEPLHSLAILFERRYNVKIHIESQELRAYKFTGTIRNETFEQVLQFLRYTTPIKYNIGKGEAWWTIDMELAKQYSKILEKKNEP